MFASAIVKTSENDHHFINMHCMENFLITDTPPPQSLGLWFSECQWKWDICISRYEKIKKCCHFIQKNFKLPPRPKKVWVCGLPYESPMYSITLPDIFFGDNRIKRKSKPIIVKITKTCSKYNNKEIHNNFRKQSSLH